MSKRMRKIPKSSFLSDCMSKGNLTSTPLYFCCKCIFACNVLNEQGSSINGISPSNLRSVEKPWADKKACVWCIGAPLQSPSLSSTSLFLSPTPQVSPSLATADRSSFSLWIPRSVDYEHKWTCERAAGRKRGRRAPVKRRRSHEGERAGQVPLQNLCAAGGEGR